ncbi:MAG: helix-turn-helix transcriptional regulator, partial [Clostridia bacterium]|nr:helix-turn-helix transcriptional regulator [Clostridia bacterium]
MSILQEVGRNIVFMREKIGVTQEWLSLETEIAGSYLREIEHGRANPSLDILARIADA